MDERSDLEALARHLEALSSETRLAILGALRTPRALHEIRVNPSADRGGPSPERPISRQAVGRHLEQLLAIGLVRRAAPGPARRELFVLNHERLFAVIDEVRNLAKLRPLVHGSMSEDTFLGAAPGPARLPRAPRLVLAYGRDDGVAFPLHGPPGTRWRIGRAPACEVCLDYDPYLSSENSWIEASQGGFVIHDAPASQNGTSVNWVRLPPGGSQRLNAGDVILAGRSLLVIQT